MRILAALLAAMALAGGCTYSSTDRAEELLSATPTTLPTDAPEPTPAADIGAEPDEAADPDGGESDTADPSPAADATPANAGWVVVENVDEFLNVRSGPGTEFDVVGAADLGITLPTTGKTETVGESLWVEVAIDGGTGWVSNNFVADTVRPTPTPVATPTPLATPTPAAPDGSQVVDAPDGLNMRRRPTTNANIIRELDHGTVVMPTGRDREDDDGRAWTEIVEGDDTGWVVTSFLRDP